MYVESFGSIKNFAGQEKEQGIRDERVLYLRFPNQPEWQLSLEMLFMYLIRVLAQKKLYHH